MPTEKEVEKLESEIKILRERTHKFGNELQKFQIAVSNLNLNIKNFSVLVKELRDELKKEVKLNSEFRLRSEEIVGSIKKGRNKVVAMVLDYVWKVALIAAGGIMFIKNL